MKLGRTVAQTLRWARAAKAQSGRGYLAQLADVLRLRAAGKGVGVDLYYGLRLFEPNRTWQQKSEYVGLWIKDRLYRVQDPDTLQLFKDKLRAAVFFQDHDIPSPPILAATHTTIDVPGMVALHSPEALKAWLAEQAPYPLFSKPSASYGGFGNVLIETFDRTGGRLVFRDGGSVSLDDFAARHGAPGKSTLIFQEVLRPHPEMAALIGPRLATARVMVLNDRRDPEIYRLGLRIPAGNSMVDNFRGGESGNLLARIDPETGKARDVLAAIGVDWRAITHSPDTGQSFEGFTLPDWEEATALLLRASRAVRGLKIQSWDVAFTDKGPVLLENNTTGDLFLVQLVADRGLATPRFMELYNGERI